MAISKIVAKHETTKEFMSGPKKVTLTMFEHGPDRRTIRIDTEGQQYPDVNSGKTAYIEKLWKSYTTGMFR